MIGQQISQFKVLDKIGEGGMGEVYLAEDARLHRKVALKFLPPHYSEDPEFKSRFEHEARAAAAGARRTRHTIWTPCRSPRPRRAAGDSIGPARHAWQSETAPGLARNSGGSLADDEGNGGFGLEGRSPGNHFVNNDT